VRQQSSPQRDLSHVCGHCGQAVGRDIEAERLDGFEVHEWALASWKFATCRAARYRFIAPQQSSANGATLVGSMARGRILVTGASTGIGQACSIRLAEIGYSVFGGIRKPSDGDRLRSIKGITPVLLDVTSGESLQGALAIAGPQGLDGLVNNAGIAVIGPVELVPVEAWRRQFEVNVLGLVAVTQTFLPLLRAIRGRFVNIGSIGGRSARPCAGSYDATKFAVEAISDTLRKEVQGSGVSVSVVEAGAVATRISEKSLEAAAGIWRDSAAEPREAYETLMAAVQREVAHSMHNTIDPDEVAKVVEHALTSTRPKTRYLVGKDIRKFLLLNVLPDRWRDWLILKRLAGRRFIRESA